MRRVRIAAALVAVLALLGIVGAAEVRPAQASAERQQGGYEQGFTHFMEASQSTGADPYVLAAIYEVCDSPEYDTWLCVDDDDEQFDDYEGEVDGQDFESSLAAVAHALNESEKVEVRPSDIMLDDGYSGGFAQDREELDGQAGQRLRDDSHEAWVATVERLPIEDAEDNADQIVETARGWLIGDSSAVQCSPSDDADLADGDTGDVDVPSEYEDALASAAETSGFSGALLAAQIEQESGWDTGATSPVGAQGIAQFMPDTWEEFGEGDINDPEASIRAQGEYMLHLREMVEGHADSEEHVIELTLAAYNAGPGAVQNAGWSTPPYEETQDYVVVIPEMAGDGVSVASTACEYTVNADPPDDLTCDPLDSDYEASMGELKPQTLFGLRCGVEAFDDFPNVSGTRNDPGSDHHVGGALDFGLGPNYLDDERNAYGWEAAYWWQDHAAYFDVTYVIFDDEWWTCWDDSDQWRPYGPDGGYSDDSAAHRDHPHVSFDRVDGENIGDCPQHEDAAWQ